MLPLFGSTFVLFCFVFVFMLPLKPRPFVLRHACAPTATRRYLSNCLSLFLLFFLGRCRFFRVFFLPLSFSLCMESTSYVSPSGWCFSILRPRAGFLTSAYVRINFNQKNNYTLVQQDRMDNAPQCVCVCVVFFFPYILGIQVRWTYQPGSHRRKITQDFLSTFLLRCVSREKDSTIPFPRRT